MSLGFLGLEGCVALLMGGGGFVGFGLSIGIWFCFERWWVGTLVVWWFVSWGAAICGDFVAGDCVRLLQCRMLRILMLVKDCQIWGFDEGGVYFRMV